MTWRDATQDDRRVASLWAVCVIALVAMRPLAAPVSHMLPPCLWRAWLGFACPGCGSTRTLLALARFDLLEALRANPLAAASACAFALGGVSAPAWIASGGKVPAPDGGPKPKLALAVVAAVIANWCWLVATGV